MGHQAGKGDEMQPGDRLRQAFIVPTQAPKPGRPGEAVLDHPPPRQQHEAPLRVRQGHSHQVDAVGLSGCGRVRFVVAVIDTGHLDRPAGRRLHRRSQLADHGPVVGLGGDDDQLQQLLQRTDGQVNLAPLAPFGPSSTGTA